MQKIGEDKTFDEIIAMDTEEFAPDKNPAITSDTNFNVLSYFKTEEDFTDYEYLKKYIKAIEKLVRKHPRYNSFLEHVRLLGLDFCQDIPDLKYSMGISMEMHHYPLTLFDIVYIILTDFMKNNKKISTSRVATEVLDAHWNHMINVVMLSKTGHEMYHDYNAPENSVFFINLNQTFGNLYKFYETYQKGFTETQVAMVNSYIRASKQFDSYTDLMVVNDKFENWNFDDNTKS